MLVATATTVLVTVLLVAALAVSEAVVNWRVVVAAVGSVVVGGSQVAILERRVGCSRFREQRMSWRAGPHPMGWGHHQP